MYEYDPTARMNRGNFRQKVGKGSAGYDPRAKPLMATDSMAKPMPIDPAQQEVGNGGKPMVGVHALPEPTGMTVPSQAPMPQPGDAGWNDISRYQRRGTANDSGGGGLPGPQGAGPISRGLHDGINSAHRGLYDAATGMRPEGVGPISRGVHRMADNGVGSALARGIMGGQSANNQRYAQTARAQRQSEAQGNQLRALLANGRTMEQALAETGLKGNAEWDESARKPIKRYQPRQLPPGSDRFGGIPQ